MTLPDPPLSERSRISTIISLIYSRIFQQMATGFLTKSNDVRNERARVGAIYITNKHRKETEISTKQTLS